VRRDCGHRIEVKPCCSRRHRDHRGGVNARIQGHQGEARGTDA
jgi:hypothetical protein